jgi:cytochrome b561
VNRAVHLLTWLGVIAVPAAGWFVEDWSGGTTLVVYWFETAAACLFIAARIVVHQCWNPRRGHFRYEAPTTDRRNAHRSFVRGFVVTSMAFCAGHGLILWAVLSLLSRNGEGLAAEVEWRSVAFGGLSVLILLAIDFVADLPTLRRRSFSAIEQLANRGTSRVLVVHLTLLVGFLGIAVSGASTALFGAFVVLKSLFALGGALPQCEPIAAPEGMSRVLNRLAAARTGTSFRQQWAKDRADETERREKNDRPWVDTRR